MADRNGRGRDREAAFGGQTGRYDPLSGGPGRALRESSDADYGTLIEKPGWERRYGRKARAEVGADARGPHAGRGPRGYTRPDERIYEDVCEALTAHPRLDGSDIDVRVEEGEVTLSGTVEDRRSKRLAEDLCDEIRGVRDVHNELALMDRNSSTNEGSSSNARR